jgi:carbonic anhydrase/acetyltransferase-like protein (isoleucine patch superfamily)
MPLYEIDGRRPQVPKTSWVAPSADLIGDVQLGEEVGIWFRTVIRADNTPIKVGRGTNIQEGSMLHSDPGVPLTIGEDCTVGHHAILHGCTLGDRVLVGMSATVLNGAVIGDDCLIGAGALVTEGKTFAPGSLILGAPARAVRQLETDVISSLRQSAVGYAERQAHFASKLRRLDGDESGDTPGRGTADPQN